MRNHAVSYVSLLAVAVIWGANFGFSRFAMETFDPELFTFLRFGLAVPCFFLLLRWKEGSVGLPPRALAHTFFLGLFGVTLLELLVMYSIQYTTLANASLLNVAPWPIFVALFAPLVTRERMTQRLALGGAVAMIGVAFVVLGAGGFDLSSKHMLGNAMAFGVSIIGALFNLGTMPLMRRYSALRISAWTILFGSLLMAPLTTASWGKVDWAALGAVEWSVLAYNVLFCTVIAFIAWNASMFKVGAARSNFFRYAVPAAAVVAGYLMFGETIRLPQLAGAALMAFGLVWIGSERKPVEPLPKAA
ncbi:DMT family transporter [Paenibacillus sp.]|uniref:DMT family transporter n=1 Tax=Paenibacillus sp. TaxID=58172 RepID=UPI002D616088|nr:DMT family transporter [Paenibacillus sp.]HZG58001.1 DMT family transporter [Paenibacillus sp.]